jgi:Phage integrase family
VHVVQGKGSKGRSVLFPSSFRGELGQYIHGQRERRAVFLFESNRLWPYSTRRIRIIHKYAAAAGIQKRVYPHLFRHRIITFLTRKEIISPKLQLLSGHAEKNSLAIYRDLALAKFAINEQWPQLHWSNSKTLSCVCPIKSLKNSWRRGNRHGIDRLKPTPKPGNWINWRKKRCAIIAKGSASGYRETRFDS